jgi:hypothetical protein
VVKRNDNGSSDHFDYLCNCFDNLLRKPQEVKRKDLIFMIISRKRYEAELEKARREGFEQAMKERYQEESFRTIHERINRLENMINKPNPVGFETGERKC